jgi:DNA processing protein
MSRVCPLCARRSWLLAKLSVRLDFRSRDLSRFWDLLELADLELIDAIGGRRRAELRAAYAAWKPIAEQGGQGRVSICRHSEEYPRALRADRLAPHTLAVSGELERLRDMLDRPVAAIVGTRRASDYGMEVARELARGLAACGVTVASGLSEGIAAAAHTGALEAGGAPLAVMTGDVERCSPAWCAPLHRRIVEHGCAVSECRLGGRERRWWRQARDRTLALLAQLTLVVEAEDTPWDLATAHVAWSRGRHVAAVPGRVSSAASSGTNSLLMSGARLVRGPQDALDVLFGAGARRASGPPSEPATLEPRLARVLERMGRGEDTLEKLVRGGAEPEELSLTLAELELRGAIVRGDAGRYVPCADAWGR